MHCGRVANRRKSCAALFALSSGATRGNAGGRLARALQSTSQPVTRLHAAAACFALAILCAPRADADQPHHALGFTLDAGVASNRDDILVPRALSGPRLGLGATYAGLLGPGTLHAQLHIAASFVLDRDAYPGLSFDHAVGADYVFDLGRSADIRFAFGPALGADTDVLAVSAWDDAHAYWIATRWLGVAWRAFAPAWRGLRWDLSVELPLFGLLSRPPSYRMNKQDALNHIGFFIADVQRDPRAAWLADIQQLRLALDLWRSDSSNFVPSGWAFGAETRIAHVADPRSAFALRLTFRFSATWEL